MAGGPRNEPLPVTKPGLLLVEGDDEVAVFTSLLQQTPFAQHFAVEAIRGKDRFAETVRALPNRTGYRELQVLGLVRDADESADSAEQALLNALASAGLPVPSASGQVAPGRPAAALLVVPGGGRQGYLEHLLLDSLADHADLACVDSFFRCCGLDPLDYDLGKRRLRTWGCANSAKGRALADLLREGPIELAHRAFDPLRQFVLDLANHLDA